jgi:hypothetical protein
VSWQSPEEIGRVPHVRLSVHGPKKTGAALRSLFFSTRKSRFESIKPCNAEYPVDSRPLSDATNLSSRPEAPGDLQFCGRLPETLNFFAQPELSSRPERTRISCHVALETTACAAFSEESRMKFANATDINRKSGVAHRSAASFRPYSEVNVPAGSPARL